MCGKKGMFQSPKVKWKDLEGPYQSFCRFRYDIQTKGMPDYRTNIFLRGRVFDGYRFAIEDNSNNNNNNG